MQKRKKIPALLLTLLLALDDIDTPEEAETAAPKEA